MCHSTQFFDVIRVVESGDIHTEEYTTPGTDIHYFSLG
ncbi:hypothetical protein [Escherichia coli ISC41]|nr:hypothetical protein [Escherichia coli ISC41]